jgi:hypothetical protein
LKRDESSAWHRNAIATAAISGKKKMKQQTCTHWYCDIETVGKQRVEGSNKIAKSTPLLQLHKRKEAA